MTYFTKQYHPPGTSPGTLTHREHSGSAEIEINLISYSDSDYSEESIQSVNDCLNVISQNTVKWVHIHGQPSPAILKEFADIFSLHPLALEDILNSGQRPKVEAYDSQLFTITSLPMLTGDAFRSEQISIFTGKDYILSFHAGEVDPFEPVRKRLRTHGSKIRLCGADYLLYCLLDSIVDEGFPLLEKFGEQIESLEIELLDKPDQNTLHKLHAIKRELLLLRRILWPQRELLNKLIRDDSELIKADTTIYLRDCYDHTIQIMDLLESYRDMTASMLDVYLSSISYRLNDVMRVLTVIATIFIPLTFIVGVYGMNFSANSKSPWAMPELNAYYGYPLLWIVMMAVAVGMIIYFKRKKWF